jgi:glutamate N-acetyltransferase/amino-acid N-acetyltransferase
LAVLTTDAQVSPDLAQQALSAAVELTFNRIDSDGCMSTNDTVLLLANGASGLAPDGEAFTAAVTEVCRSLARAMVADAEGATKEILVRVGGAGSESDALAAARSIAGSNLFKTAMFGEDPNWGRIVAAAGASTAAFDADGIAVTINGVQVCRDGAAFGDVDAVNLTGREVQVLVDLGAGEHSADIWTNDLSHGYVHENSAYSS